MLLLQVIAVLLVGLLLIVFIDHRLTKKAAPSRRAYLIELLEEAAFEISEYSGGFSEEYASIEVFRVHLMGATAAYAAGNEVMLEWFERWFGPSGAWAEFVGEAGEALGHEIHEVLRELNHRSFEPNAKEEASV